jgi:1-aminocyclopropane-1-carboxylate deaminase/D-cysteine desulfhydrase-like pyridoxal-dependent ACC family enzyme
MLNIKPLQVIPIYHPIAVDAGVRLFMARADTVHPLASGNKIYKLKPILEFAKNNNINQLLSFGGAYSNHNHALALIAEQYGLRSVGIIRGEKEYANNPTLTDAKNAGMQLEFVNRKVYKQRKDASYLEELQKRYPDSLIIPEGGSSQMALAGCAELSKEINLIQQSNVLTVASGTGATLAGLISGAAVNQKVIAYAVLRDQSLAARVEQFLALEGCGNNNYDIEAADFGGYAKLDKDLLDFILTWFEETGVLLDPIYTGKMCMRLMQQIKAKKFDAGMSITMVHSGGLQGWRGMRSTVEGLAGDHVWNLISDVLTRK